MGIFILFAPGFNFELEFKKKSSYPTSNSKHTVLHIPEVNIT